MPEEFYDEYDGALSLPTDTLVSLKIPNTFVFSVDIAGGVCGWREAVKELRQQSDGFLHRGAQFASCADSEQLLVYFRHCVFQGLYVLNLLFEAG